MSVDNIRKWRGTINKQCEGKNVFQFAEYCDTPKARTFLYIDLNVEWHWNTYHEDPFISHHAFNGHFPDIKMFRRRFEMQHLIEDGITGLLLDNDDPQTLADMMLRLLTDDSFRQNVEARRDQYIKEYSWEAVAERCLEVINGE